MAVSVLFQNTAITPAGVTARPAPVSTTPLQSDPRNQKFVLVVTGVAGVDLQGTLANDWRHQTISLGLDLAVPLKHAIAEHGITRPPGVEGNQYVVGFQVEQFAPFAAPASIFNAGTSVHAGYAVDAWHLNALGTAPDAFSGATLINLFTGISIDLAVRNKEAVIHRVAYHVTLIGKIVFRVRQF
jgi:hypothetical protein